MINIGIGVAWAKRIFNVAANIVANFRERVAADDGIFEAGPCLDATLLELDDIQLLGDQSLMVTPNAYKEDVLYSVIPLDGSGDLNVVRATTATRVNSEGLIEVTPYNLLTYSEQFDNADWTKVRSSITTNATTAPNGTLTADKLIADVGIDTSHYAQYIATGEGIYTASIFAKKNTVDWLLIRQGNNGGGTSLVRAWFDLSNGVIGASSPSAISHSIEDYGNGWYRCSMTFDVLEGGFPRAQFYLSTGNEISSFTSDGTENVFIWGAQLVQGTSAKDYFPTTDRLNVPRLDYTNGGCPSILVEPQKTNLLLRSEEFDNVSWVKTDSTITANSTIAPNGTLSADKFISSNALSGNLLEQNIGFILNPYTFSIYAKKGEFNYIQLLNSGNSGYANFDLENGVIGSYSASISTIENVGNGWYRCNVTFTTGLLTSVRIAIATSATSTRLQRVVGDGTSGIYIWGAQLEAGSYATSYIPTIASSVTRNADVISKTGISDLIGQTEGTVYAEIKNIGNEIGGYILEISDNSNTNRIVIQNGAVANRLNFYAQSASGVQLNTSPANVFTDSVKIAFSYANNYYSIYANGVQLLSGTSFNVPICNKLNVGSRDNNTQIFGGSINSAILWKERLTDEQLILLTGDSFDTYNEMANALIYTIQ